MNNNLKSVLKNNNNANKQLRYLSQPVFLEESVYPPLMTRTIVLTTIVLLLLLIWASVSKISEVAVSSGEVVPGEYIQLIQHLEGGMISDIAVKEGEVVHEGQILATLDGLDFKKDLTRLELRQLDLTLQAERLNAFVKHKEPDFNSITYGHEQLKQEQMDVFISMNNSRDSAMEVIGQQINQKKELINNLEGKKKTLGDNIALVQQEYDMKKKLVEKGAISKVAYLAISKQYNEIKGSFQEVSSNIAQTEGSISELNDKLTSLEAEYLEDAYSKLEKIKSQIVQNSETIEKLTDKVARLEIKSPTNGLVKKIEVTTVGGVLAPGQPIMEILPIDENMIVECKIKPSDIGHIVIGQLADVKVSSFDFSRYGSIQGKLSYISATTFESKDGRKYYLGRISLNKNYVGDNPKANIIVPGMTVQASIITGEKTILSYLLKPIKTSLDSALSER